MVPPLFRPGDLLPLDRLERLSGYLPPEIWERRDVFFFEGQQLEVGPCHRIYPAAPFFEEATERDAGKAHLDEDGNLHGYTGEGLPFDWRDIADDAPDAGARWAWNMRYRYQGSGYRGEFRLLHVARRGRKIDRYEGSFYMFPMYGYPGARRNTNASFWAGGAFTSPSVARGVAWRQLHPEATDRDAGRSDEVWVWIPDERKVRRAPPTAIDGIYMPTYIRGNAPMSRAVLPDGSEIPGETIATTEHTRIGFTGLILRPNQYRWEFLRSQDVLAPINGKAIGYPGDPDRSYGPRGQSLASDRWDLRRAAVLRGVVRDPNQIGSVVVYVDVQTQQPLYMIARRRNKHIFEVGAFSGRFSGDDALHPHWVGGKERFGVILPAAASFYTGRGLGWLRESFELRSDPPEEGEARDMTTVIKLQRGR